MRKQGKKSIRIFALLAVAVYVLAAPAEAHAKSRGLGVTIPAAEGDRLELYRGSYALVLGNSSYKNGLDPLPGVRQDVKDVARALERNGFEVTAVTDLTRSEFQRAVEAFALRYGSDPENRLLFYYAGHGYTEQTATGDAVGYLMMVDAPHPDRDRLGFRLASVDMQYFITQSKLIQAKHVLFLFDSCFSGTILNFRAAVRPEAVSDAVRYPVRQYITAGRANEPVPDRSVFKQAFVDILEGRAREPVEDGYLTGEELGLYLKTTVPQYSPNQNPQYGKIRDINLDKGDFVFEIDPAGRRAVGAGLPMRESAPQQTELAKQQAQLEEQKRLAQHQQAQLAAMQAEIERLKQERELAAPKREKQAPDEKKTVELQIPESESKDGEITAKEAPLQSIQQASLSPETDPKPNAPVDRDKPWQGNWGITISGWVEGGSKTWHLLQDGDRVQAQKGSSNISGLRARIKGNRLTGNLEWANGANGSISLTMSPDGNSFKGWAAWRSENFRIKARRMK